MNLFLLMGILAQDSFYVTFDYIYKPLISAKAWPVLPFVLSIRCPLLLPPTR